MEQEHKEEDCECYRCKYGEDAMMHHELELMEKFGWFVHMVPNEDMPYGICFHTHGLEVSFGHLDLQIVVNIPGKLANSILADAVNLIKEGTKFESGQRYPGILSEYDVTFHETTESGRPVLRMILPDKENNLEHDAIAEVYSKQWD